MTTGGETNAAIVAAAETFDALTSLDLPRRGAIAALHAEARRIVGGPLARAAARGALARTPDGAVVAILTGFPEFPWIRRGVAETDGPIGAAVLARSFVKARRAIPIIPCEAHFAPVIQAASLAGGVAAVREVAWRRPGPRGGDNGTHIPAATRVVVDRGARSSWLDMG